MTDKAKANLYNFLGIPVAGLAVLGAFLIRDQPSIPGILLLSLSGVGMFVLTILSIAMNRCPHCKDLINLAGPSAFCPRCGEWIPFHEDDPPPAKQESTRTSVPRKR